MNYIRLAIAASRIFQTDAYNLSVCPSFCNGYEDGYKNCVDDNGGAYFVPAFSGLFAPHWRPDARGALVGLTRYVNKGHIARAVEDRNRPFLIR